MTERKAITGHEAEVAQHEYEATLPQVDVSNSPLLWNDEQQAEVAAWLDAADAEAAKVEADRRERGL